MRRWRPERTLLLLILAIGAALRFWGLGFGLPQPLARPDEEFIVATATGFFSGDWNPHFFDWPSLAFYLVHGLMRAQYALGHLTGRYPDLQTFVRAVTESPAGVILLNRVVGALCGVFTLVVVYRVTTRLAGVAQALIATFFLAVALLHVRDSHFGLLDVPVTLLIVASFTFFVRAWQEDRPLRHFLIAGAIAGLATSIKYNAGALACVAGVAALLRVVARPADRRRTLVALAGCGAAMVTMFLVGSPYVLLARAEFLKDLRIQREHLFAGHFGIVIQHAWLHHLTFGLRYGLGLPLLIAAVAGIGFAFWRSWRIAAILMAFPAVTYGVLGIGHIAFARYLIPLLPFLCIAAGIAVWSALSRIRSAPARALAAAVVTIAIGAPTIVADIGLDRLLRHEDTRVLAAKWLTEHGATPLTMYASGEVFARPYLTQTSAGPQVEFSTRTGSFVWGEAQSMAPSPEWIVLPESALSRYTLVPDPVRELVVREYGLQQMFLGARSQESPEWFDPQDAFFVPLADLRFRDRPGPDLYIYQRRTRQ